MSADSSDSQLSKFFERIKTMGFFARLFSWKSFAAMSYDAYQEYKVLSARLEEAVAKLRDIQSQYDSRRDGFVKMEKDYDAAKSAHDACISEIQEKGAEISRLTESNTNKELRIGELNSEVKSLTEKLTRLSAEKSEIDAEVTKKKADAVKDFNHINNLNKDLETLKEKSTELIEAIKKNESEIGKLREADSKNIKRIAELDAEVASLKNAQTALNEENLQLEKKLTEWEEGENLRDREYDDRVKNVNTLQQQLEGDRQRLQKEREEDVAREFEEMKQTWHNHEVMAEERLKGICNSCGIEYCDKESFPYSGKPDNSIKICGEYVIFDAKSPQNDDLRNFPDYIKSQATAAKKYAKQDGVKKDIFLVIPSNAVSVIDNFHYDMADYSVFVVTLDSLRPIIMTLKRIEDYEFADKLSPEDRDSICRVIGKFVHASKRRIQIDAYFCQEVAGILGNCSGLPDDIQGKVDSYERADIINPPMEKRAKAISENELKKSLKLIKHEADYHNIDTEVVTEVLEGVPVEKPDNEN